MVPAPRVLLIEDDRDLASTMRDYLTRHAFVPTIAENGACGVRAIHEGSPDLVILDLTLPLLDGHQVCRQVRPRYRGPILMLTARSETVDEILGLELGADDYLRKPVEPRLLLARVRALLRRCEERSFAAADRLQLGRVVIDPARRELTVDGVDAQLTSAEFDLVWQLAERAGSVVTREELHLRLRGVEYDGLDRSIDLRVARVRRKIGALGTRLVCSVRGVGYQLTGSV